MRRGTTPRLTFTIPYTAGMIASGYLTFKQNRRVILDVPFSDDSIEVVDNAVRITLTQEQTLAMSHESTVKAQIRMVLAPDTAVASNIVEIPIGAILKEGVI